MECDSGAASGVRVMRCTTAAGAARRRARSMERKSYTDEPRFRAWIFRVGATGPPLRGVATRVGPPAGVLRPGLSKPGIAGQHIGGWPGWRLLSPDRAAHRGPHPGKDPPLGDEGVRFKLRGVLSLRSNA